MENKQETLEEAAGRYTESTADNDPVRILAFIEGAKWQQERMYSEEEVIHIVQRLMYDVHCGDICEGDKIIDFKISPIKWVEQFKKKVNGKN